VVRSVNELVCRRADHVQQFATFFLAQIDEEGRFRYTNAGHNPPLLLSPDGGVRRLECGGMMLGVMEVASYEEETLSLAPGDRLVVYTDGISEREDPSGAEYGDERLLASLRTLPAGLPPEVVVERSLAALEAFASGVEAADDQTLLVLSVAGPAG
jgi:sigma-B regulation protein RsbU (phosphoserine phosphatase)